MNQPQHPSLVSMEALGAARVHWPEQVMTYYLTILKGMQPIPSPAQRSHFLLALAKLWPALKGLKVRKAFELCSYTQTFAIESVALLTTPTPSYFGELRELQHRENGLFRTAYDLLIATAKVVEPSPKSIGGQIADFLTAQAPKVEHPFLATANLQHKLGPERPSRFKQAKLRAPKFDAKAYRDTKIWEPYSETTSDKSWKLAIHKDNPTWQEVYDMLLTYQKVVEGNAIGARALGKGSMGFWLRDITEQEHAKVEALKRLNIEQWLKREGRDPHEEYESAYQHQGGWVLEELETK